jgi:beta-glucanase (GH16 family)
LRIWAIGVLLAAIALDSACLFASTIEPTGQHGGWELLYSDEFNGTSLDRTRWVTCYWWDRGGCTNRGNHELQWYLPGNVTVTGGHLRLRAERSNVDARDGNRYAYTSGLISTGRDVAQLTPPPRFEFQYGYAEMRARLPAGRGLFPAFWMLPSDHDSLPEIDIMEVLGHQPSVLYTYFHFADALKHHKSQHGIVDAPDLSAGWHVFGVDWEPDRIVWYLDGIERWRYDDAGRVPHEPMYLLINLAVGGTWPGSPDSSTRWPAEMTVDYVRVWKKRPR